MIRFTSIAFFWIICILGTIYLSIFTFAQKEENSINIFAWGDIFDSKIISRFEKETGIKVHLNYYSSNEELLVKMKATKGEGYDLIVPSDYAVKQLIADDLLQPIDRSKLSFWSQIDPRFLGLFYDPDNRYSIPLEWEVFGIGVDRDYLKEYAITPSWEAIFKPNPYNYTITMPNDPVEAIQMASFYLYGPKDELLPEQITEVRNLLKEQKNWTKAYVDARGDYYLATKNCPLVVTSSSYLIRSMRTFPFVDFVLPPEGSFLSIENIAIPKTSDKEKLVYQLVNYLFTPESILDHYEQYGFFFPIANTDFLPLSEKEKQLLEEVYSNFAKYQYFHRLISSQDTRNLWVEVKSF